MLKNFFAQLFDAPAEIVIGHGRVVLAAISLAAITLDPSEPKEFAEFVGTTLILYAGYALVVLAALHWGFVHNPNSTLIHSIDLVVLALLLFLTEGLSSPFLVFFTFTLLAASLRWDWRGIALTMMMLLLLAGVVAVIDFGADGKVSDVNQTVIRAAYLVVTGTILAYTSAHREHEQMRLARLARWPAEAPAGTSSGSLAEPLRHAAAVLEARGALVVWEADARGSKAALWYDGQYNLFEARPNGPILAVVPELGAVPFSRTAPDLARINLPNGSIRFVPDVLTGELVSTLQITDFSSSPFHGLVAKGRLFVFGNIRPSDDHLPITSIVADRVGAELDRQIFLRRAAEAAAMSERSAIMRDLHDGLLQNLTAVRTQLELWMAGAEGAKDRLHTVRELLKNEQQRVRIFVDATHAADHESVALAALRPLADDTARFWGCTLALAMEPDSVMVSRKTINQLSLMLAEAVANAVRHGEATTVQVTVAYTEGGLEVDVRDDGHGFPNCCKTGGPQRLADAELPRSLSARTSELGGRMQAWTSVAGSVLRFELPL